MLQLFGGDFCDIFPSRCLPRLSRNASRMAGQFEPGHVTTQELTGPKNTGRYASFPLDEISMRFFVPRLLPGDPTPTHHFVALSVWDHSL